MGLECFAPNELLNDTNKARIFGLRVAEPVIQDDYLKSIGVSRGAVYPDNPAGKICFDENRGVANYDVYIRFLRLHHGRDIRDEKVWLDYHFSVRAGEGLLNVPDIIIFDPPGRREFYEIKPNSGTGKSEGIIKITNIHGMLTDLSMKAGPNSVVYHFKYNPGVQYSPNKTVQIHTGLIIGSHTKTFLHFWLAQPGLILYEVCLETVEVRSLAEIILLIILLILLRLILRGRGTIPGPGPSPVPTA